MGLPAMQIAVIGSGNLVMSATQRRRHQRAVRALHGGGASPGALPSAVGPGTPHAIENRALPQMDPVEASMEDDGPYPWIGPGELLATKRQASMKDIRQAPFKAVKLAELDGEELAVLRNPPSEAVRRAYATEAHTSIAEVEALFLFELPDYPIAREYQRWVLLNPAATDDVGISVISRGRFLRERGDDAIHKALLSLVARGRPEHCRWLLYDTSIQV